MREGEALTTLGAYRGLRARRRAAATGRARAYAVVEPCDRPQALRDREHRLVREPVEQRVDDPVARALPLQHDHVQVRAVVEELVAAAADVAHEVAAPEHRCVLPVRLLHAPVVVRAHLVDEPHGLVPALLVEPVQPDRPLAIDPGRPLEHGRHHQREADLPLALLEEVERRRGARHDVRGLALRRLVDRGRGERAVEGLPDDRHQHRVVRERADRPTSPSARRPSRTAPRPSAPPASHLPASDRSRPSCGST